jgi:hypothetical protein
MGCNDRDRLDPNKPCKNVGSPIAAPNAQPIIIPVSPILVSPKYGNDEPEEASSSGANGASCDRLFPELSKVRAKRGSANSARFEYVRLRDQFLALSDADLLKSLMNGGIGKCYLSNGCPSCACSFYLKTSAADWAGLGGWPLNPKSRGSTGCVSTHQWGGYLPSMATDDLMQNAAMQARHALCHPADPCRIHPEHHNVPIHTDDVLDQ